MLTAHHLSRSFGIHTVLNDISFNISARERVGLIGPNGCGKTTLMRILAGLDSPDQGSVTHTRPGLRIGYLAQGFEFNPGQTLAASLGLPQPGGTARSRETLESQVASLASALSRSPGDRNLQALYDSGLSQLLSRDIHPESVLGPLGLASFPPDTPVSHLSGGQKTRLMLAGVLLDDPNLLLLDEPTNHLDISMLEWLEAWLAGFHGAALIVSHDRAFLDNTVNNILELDPATGGIRSYPGNYSAYVEQKLSEHEQHLQDYSDQQAQIEQLRAAAQHLRGLTKMKKGGKADGGDKFAKGFFGNRATKNTALRAKNIEARIEKLLNEDRIEKPRPGWQLKLDFGAPAHFSRDVLNAEALAVGYPGHAPILQDLNFSIHSGQRIAVTGPNGSGKTTLVRTITGRLEPLSGSLKIGPNVRLGYMSQEQEMLDPLLSPLQVIQKVSDFNETEARHFLHFFLFSGDEPLRPNGEMSFGERTRLQLAMLVSQGCTFLILDEPVNHLDIPARARFEQALSKFEGTVLAVVHDRYFIQRFASQVWSVENGHIHQW
ncbi:MAG TPA: ABC-F family ATP-binding cassette domain-containing protein [Anaerolineales bacterium]|jgi:ATP-binding cassette subfamily F protein 3